MEIEKPNLWSEWTHKSGDIYVVCGYTNLKATDPRYPATISYRNKNDPEGRNDSEYSRKLSDWHQSMEYLGEGKPPEVTYSREQVQVWRNDIANACADVAARFPDVNPHLVDEMRKMAGGAIEEPEWIVALRRELMFSKATHNFSFSRDEVMELLIAKPKPLGF